MVEIGGQGGDQVGNVRSDHGSSVPSGTRWTGGCDNPFYIHTYIHTYINKYTLIGDDDGAEHPGFDRRGGVKGRRGECSKGKERLLALYLWLLPVVSFLHSFPSTLSRPFHFTYNTNLSTSLT